jgi:hypothetical protein
VANIQPAESYEMNNVQNEIEMTDGIIDIGMNSTEWDEGAMDALNTETLTVKTAFHWILNPERKKER